MNEAFKNLLYWRLAFLKWFINASKMAVAAYVAGVAAKAWTDMNWDARGLVLCAMYVAVATYTDGFFDQTVSRLQSGKPPVGTNGTEHFFKAGDAALADKSKDH